MKDSSISMSREEFIAEHKRLVSLLKEIKKIIEESYAENLARDLVVILPRIDTELQNQSEELEKHSEPKGTEFSLESSPAQVVDSLLETEHEIH